MSNSLATRIGGAFGAVYVVFAVLGGGISGGSDMPALSASRAEIAHWVARQHATPAAFAGGILELLGLLCFVVFAATLYRVLRRSDAAGILATTALGAALISVALKLGSVPATFALEWRAREGFEPQLAAALIDADNVAFILTWTTDALMLAAVAILVLRTRVLPRWLGILAAVTAPILLVSAPVAAHAPPLGMMLTLVWVLATGLALALRRREPRKKTAVVPA